MPLWREKLFAFLARNAAQAAECYSLPVRAALWNWAGRLTSKDPAVFSGAS
jgi:hypothetical protein